MLLRVSLAAFEVRLDERLDIDRHGRQLSVEYYAIELMQPVTITEAPLTIEEVL
jgi:hypothetical protein